MINLRNLGELGSRVETEDLFKPTKMALSFKLYLSTCSALTGLVIVGMSIGFTSSSLPSMEDEDQQFHLTPYQGALYASVLNLAAMFTVPLAGMFNSLLGRRDTMIASASLFIAGNLLTTYSSNFSLLLAGRCIVGASVGIQSVACPQYLIEVVPRPFRPQFETYSQTCLMAGIFLSYVIGYILHWQWMSFTCACVGFISIIMISIAAESPVWLVEKSRRQEAIDVLGHLRGGGVDVTDECDEIEATVIYRQLKNIKSWRQLNSKHIKPAFIMTGLIIFNQFSGAHVILFYAHFVLKCTQTIFDPGRGVIFLGVVLTLCALLTGFSRLLIRWKNLVVMSQFFFTLSNLILGIFFRLCKEKEDDYCLDHTWVPLVALLIFSLAYSCNPVITDLIVAVDIIPNELRRVTYAMLMMVLFLCSFVITLSFHPNDSDSIEPYGPFFAFFVISLIGTVYACVFVPNIKTSDAGDVVEYSRPSVTSQ